MNDLELEKKIAAIYKEAGFELDRLDTGVTLMKMSRKQKTDLAAMIDWLAARGDDASYIAGQIGHDLNGLKWEFLNGPAGFLPRSHGYAKKAS